jgi:Barstar (barnase inhibitor)
VIDPSQAREVREESARRGIPLYVISTGGEAGREVFFDAVRRVLPLNPPIVSARSWDALADSMWEGIYSLNRPRVVVLWPDSSPFSAAAPSVLETALSVFEQVASDLADVDATLGKPVEACFYVGHP